MEVKSIILQVGVKCFLRNPNNKYLLLKRSLVKYGEVKNNWDIPGGRIIPGTSLKENLRREVLEETKLQMNGNLKLIYSQDIIRPNKHIVRLTYTADVQGDPVLDKEHVEYQWLTLDEMRKEEKLDEFAKEVLLNYFIK